jgi:DNA-binding XRE family transcriptional regulator
MPNVDFAALVRLIRQACRETQEKFAWDLDVSVGTMNGRENGKRRPVTAQRRRLISLAEGMGVRHPEADSNRRERKGS